MKIYTSYYKKMENIGVNYVLVQVSVSKPNWFRLPTIQLKEVYPDWRLVSGLKSGEISRQEFTDRYMQQLRKLSRIEILSKLKTFSNANDYEDVVLLCWENKSGFCHRHILADWLDKDVTELEV